MEDRCPIFMELLEDPFRATTEAIDAESRLKRSGMLPVEVNEDLRLKLEAARFAQKTLKEHVNEGADWEGVVRIRSTEDGDLPNSRDREVTEQFPD